MCDVLGRTQHFYAAVPKMQNLNHEVGKLTNPNWGTFYKTMYLFPWKTSMPWKKEELFQNKGTTNAIHDPKLEKMLYKKRLGWSEKFEYWEYILKYCINIKFPEFSPCTLCESMSYFLAETSQRVKIKGIAASLQVTFRYFLQKQIRIFFKGRCKKRNPQKVGSTLVLYVL